MFWNPNFMKRVRRDLETNRHKLLDAQANLEVAQAEVDVYTQRGKRLEAQLAKAENQPGSQE